MVDSFAHELSDVFEPDFAIELVNLTKNYHSESKRTAEPALKSVSLKIPRGRIYGLLGPNGAGKSTLINILAGLTIKTSGQAFIWGFEVEKEARKARSAIGVVPQELNLDAFFTSRELLKQQAGFYGVPRKQQRTEELLEILDLKDVADASTSTLSGGMRRRLMMAKAMVHNPPVLILDEPTAGVDVELRHSLWAYVRKLSEAGATVLLTTHYLEEAEQLCDDIAILNQGELVANDSKANLLARLDSKQVTVTLSRDMVEMPASVLKQGWQYLAPNRLTLPYKPSETTIGQVLLNVQAHGYSITDLNMKEPDLESVFLQLTQENEKPVPVAVNA